MKAIKLLTLLSLIFLATSLDAQPVKKVFIEKFTSARCGNCPRATETLKTITENEENVIWLSHHSDWIPDAMHLDDLSPIYSAYTISAPRVCFNRVLFDNNSRIAISDIPSGTWAQRLNEQLNTPAITSVNIAGNRDDNLLTFNVEISFTETPEAGNFRLSVFAVEDIVVGSGNGYDQRNYDNNNPSSPLYQLGDPILNYEHRNVTRAIISDIWGTSGIIPNNPEIGTTYIGEYTYEVPEDFDFEEIRIVAALHYYDENDFSNHYVLNANEAYAHSFVETSISEPEIFTLKSYPNPFSNQTFIELENISQNVELIAYSLTGKMIQPDYQIENNGIKVSANTLLPGIYIFEVITHDGELLGTGRWVVK